MANGQGNVTIPLCVDLDNCLVRTNTLIELILVFVKPNPFRIFLCFLWLLRGRVYLKYHLAQRVSIDVESLPYNDEILSRIYAERTCGRPIVLATGADEVIASAVAAYLNVFDVVLSSTHDDNLIGQRKAERLKQLYPAGFDYIGDSGMDLPVWKAARHAIVVTRSQRLVSRAQSVNNNVQSLLLPAVTLSTYCKALRVTHWSKNLLVLLPLLAAHQWFNHYVWTQAAIAFVALCCSASMIYMLNDLFDLPFDRKHEHKSTRPFASGDLTLAWGLLAVPLLLLAAISVSLYLSNAFLALVLFYIVLTFAYTMVLKSYLMVDVILLAIFYTLRVFAGGLATAITVSNWLLAFSLFFFLSLALLKRVSDLKRSETDTEGRAYTAKDSMILTGLGISSGYIASLILAVYAEYIGQSALYTQPRYLWLLSPLWLYWIGRIWLLAYRGEIPHDPVLFALKDKVSYFVFAASALVILLAV